MLFGEGGYGKLLLLCMIYTLCFLYGSFMFTTGLLPYSPQIKKNASFADLPPEPSPERFTKHKYESVYKRHYDRTVIVLIDGLRADFLQHTHFHPLFFERTPFSYIDGLIKSKKAFSFNMKAYSPTVTLPRIKTLLSGTLPSFLDVVTNFNAGEMLEDNLVFQARSQNHKINFYGDNTWVLLFPNVFYRHEGTHSFYVSDYKEVDDNVTRHLKAEVPAPDWDMLILHYLGVDHIGHSKGPSSPLMPRKLEEMDSVIQYLHENLNSNKCLIVVCGDHGMTVSGNHGGNSNSELWTPLVFINNKEYGALVNNISKSVSQVDVATTMSVLLGLPIPANSMGVIIPEALHFSGFTYREVLYAAYYNLHHLYNLYKTIYGTGELLKLDSVQELTARHRNYLKLYGNTNNRVKEDMDYMYLLNTYMKKLFDIKEALVQNSTGYNTDAMVIGLVAVWISALSFLCFFLHLCMHSSIVPVDWWVCFYRVCPFMLLIICQKLFPVWMTSTFIILLTLCANFFCQENNYLKSLSLSCGNDQKILAFFVFLSVVSLASSSLVEEEHQVWYFLSGTIMFLLLRNTIHSFVYSWIKKNLQQAKRSSPRDYSSEERHRMFLQLHKRYSGAPDADPYTVALLVAALISTRVLRHWNQTGDKWSHLPDIRDWLDEHRSSPIYHCLIIVSEIVIFVLLSKDLISVTSCVTKDSNFVSCLVVFSALTWVYVSKCHGSLLRGLAGHFASNEIVLGSRIVYLHMVTLALMAAAKHIMYHPQKYFKAYVRGIANFIMHFVGSWVVLTINLTRVENIPVVSGVLLLEYILNKVTWTKFSSCFFNMFVYVVMAMCSFFYMGNSNSLSTVNVFAGYTGLTTYHPVLVGFLIMCDTYNCPVIWVMLGFYRMYCVYHVNLCNNESKSWFVKEVVSCCLSLVLYRMFVQSFYMVLIYIQRYHLFIMSVFLPKLFYEIVHSFVFLCLVCMVLLFCL